MTTAKILAVLALAASALTIEPQNANTEWLDVEYPDGTSIQGEISYRYTLDGICYIHLMDGRVYEMEVGETEFSK